jgi:hypothetical protein
MTKETLPALQGLPTPLVHLAFGSVFREALSFLLAADEPFLDSLDSGRSSLVGARKFRIEDWASARQLSVRNMVSAEGRLSQLDLDLTAFGDIYGVQVFELPEEPFGIGDGAAVVLQLADDFLLPGDDQIASGNLSVYFGELFQ